MSKCISGYFSGTKGDNVVTGSIDYTKANDSYSSFINKRKDVDVNGFYDIIAHGTPHSIQIQSGEQTLEIDHRSAARLFKNNPALKNKSIRLLSCSTGESPTGFAQNLANKLNVVVEAPTNLVWAWSNGKYIVAGRSKSNPNYPDPKSKGHFKKFYPGGNKNERRTTL